MSALVRLPTRNEATSVAGMVQAVRTTGMGVFVVDARSTDETCAIAHSLTACAWTVSCHACSITPMR